MKLRKTSMKNSSKSKPFLIKKISKEHNACMNGKSENWSLKLSSDRKNSERSSMKGSRKSISMKNVRELSKIGLSRASSSNKKRSIKRKLRTSIRREKMKRIKRLKRV